MKRIALALLSLACMQSTQAAPFADPTQPPMQRGPGDAGTATGQRIESILIAPDRRVAVINGQQVTIGSRVGSGVVVRITETEVVLRRDDGEQTLKLFPELVRESTAPEKKGRAR